MSQLWLNFNQTSASSWWGGGGGQVRFYCIIEQSARGASVRRHHHTSVWVHVIVWWLRVDTWHGLDTLGSAATAQTITGSLILIVAPHYSDCLFSQLSHTKAAFMPWIDSQLYTLWSYQLLQKGRRFSAAKLHFIDFNWPLMPLSCIDIRYWVSYNPEICRKSWKMTSRKT